MQVLVGGLAVAVIYSLVFAYIRQEGFAYSFTHGMIVALGAMGIAFVLWAGMGIGFENTWPFWLYYAALLAIMSFFKLRVSPKTEKEAEAPSEAVCQMIEDCAHFAQGYNRTLHIYCDGRQIVVKLSIICADELRNRCQGLNSADIYDVFFERYYTPQYGYLFCDLLLEGTHGAYGDWLEDSRYFGKANKAVFCAIKRNVKRRYSNYFKSMGEGFWIQFNAKY